VTKTTERRLYDLKTINSVGAQKGITASVADDVKWAANLLELLGTYVRSCPARAYWVQVAKNDARVRDWLEL